jgi:hypothetical protein
MKGAPMPKIKDPQDIQIRFGKIIQDEYELPAHGWYDRRANVFAQLRKHGFIPAELLDLIEDCKDQTIVKPSFYKHTDGKDLRVLVKVDAKQEVGGRAAAVVEDVRTYKRLRESKNDKEGKTASEVLAFLLKVLLREVKEAEKAKTLRVRKLGLVPRSLIAEVAMDLLESCATWGLPPGNFLCSLLLELLNLDRDRQTMPGDSEKKDRAAALVAQAPNVGTRQLARQIKVDASTISRWRKSPEFQQMVEDKAASSKASASQIWVRLKSKLSPGEFSYLLSLAKSARALRR